MTLSAYLAELRNVIFRDLQGLKPPSVGSFNMDSYKELTGQPQMGSVTYLPHQIRLEFIFKNPVGAPKVFEVSLTPPERMVFLPVPTWVIQSIWQGEISGSYHFESDAESLVNALIEKLKPVENAELFNSTEMSPKN